MACSTKWRYVWKMKTIAAGQSWSNLNDFIPSGSIPPAAGTAGPSSPSIAAAGLAATSLLSAGVPVDVDANVSRTTSFIPVNISATISRNSSTDPSTPVFVGVVEVEVEDVVALAALALGLLKLRWRSMMIFMQRTAFSSFSTRSRTRSSFMRE